MIDRPALLSDLQKLLSRLEDDLLQRSESAEVPQVGQRLREEYERAKKAERTGQNYEDWRSDAITQAAAAWVLSCVFVRFLEDNRLIGPPRISGPTGSNQEPTTKNQQQNHLQRARDEHELYFRSHPKLTDRDYLLAVFDELAGLPGTKDVFSEHNPIRELPNWLSGDAAGELLRFFQKIDANTGLLVHDFTDDGWDTRFLGDLYQDLSEAARKKYALLQTPEFVEEFILDRTLEPALDEFGLGSWSFVLGSLRENQPQSSNNQEQMTNNLFKMIDPACGSGHFLLGSFRRILDRWQKKEPGANIRDLVQRTLDSIHGVDVNPYAVAIARFRLLLVAMRAEGIKRLADAPSFEMNLACGDSLLHAPIRVSATEGQRVLDFELADDSDECEHAYRSENLPELKRILRRGQYHAVVANPPYIVPKDRQLNERYRKRFSSCHMKYSLAVPFMEQIFRLARRANNQERTTNNQEPAGFTGQITANSFMKREFGKKLIEQFLPTVDLSHVIDTSVACIPGHNTPTVILLGRNRPPVASTLRTVMGIRGESSTPVDPTQGLAWSAIRSQVDQPGSQSEFISVGDSRRELFYKHPWSIGGGGAAELKEQLDEAANRFLGEAAESIGITCFTLEDDVFVLPRHAALRRGMKPSHFRMMIEGDAARDWTEADCDVAVFPYDPDFAPIPDEPAYPSLRYLWYARTGLANNKMFGGNTKVEEGLKWYEYGRLTSHKLLTPLSIVYGEIATHNHFVLDRGGKLFNRTAPVIKLPPETTEDEHLALLGLLNSSTACFWMKQITQPKTQTTGMDFEAWQVRRAFNATRFHHFPLPEERPLALAQGLDRLSQRLGALSPIRVLSGVVCDSASLRFALASAHEQWKTIRRQMIALQEELDWECYRLYGLNEEDVTLLEPPPLKLGQRAFEIVLARRIAANETQTTWFERHRATPITEIPAEWPDDYRQVVARRIAFIERDPNIRLVEQPEYKRRWDTESWESQLERALSDWLLNRVETYFDFDGRMNDEGKSTAKLDIALTSVAKLADVARQDPDFMQVGEVCRDDPAYDVERLVAELVEAESVPLLPVLRYKPGGLRKRAEWEQTWELQRLQDKLLAGESLVLGSWFLEKRTVEALEQWQQRYAPESGTGSQDQTTKNQELTAILSIPVPPKYTSADFLKSDYWRLRGKLDVPKQRWVSFPHCEGPDGTQTIAWAGYDHLQLARSVSAYYVDIQERLGGRDDPRLVPLLACLLELVPWLKQWHNEPDAAFDGMCMGDYFEGFINEEARSLPRPGGGSGWTLDEIRAWQPPQRPGGRRKRS